MSPAEIGTEPTKVSMYVYYRVEADLAQQAQSRVRELFSSARQVWPGLRTRLLRKVDDTHPGRATWMEVYEHPQGVSTACQAQVKEMAQTLLAGLTGERHVEVFAPLPEVGLAG